MTQSSIRIGARVDMAVGRRRGLRLLVPELALGLAAAVLALLGAVFTLRLWDVDLNVPFAYLVDGVFYLMVIKAVLDHGWIGENPNLGTPFGQSLWDFPSVNGDALQLLLVKAIGLFTDDVGIVFNLFFLLTFPLTGLVAFLVLRLLGASRGSSLVCGVLYALLPFHFERDEHIFFASYYTVPLACYVALSVVAGAPLISRAAPWRTALVVLACVTVGAASTYYAAFSVALIGVAALVALIAGRGRRAVVQGVVAAGVIGLTALALLVPTLVYWAEHGENNTERRRPIDTEFYSLKLPQLVLPVAGHRIDGLAEVRQRYDANFGQTEGNSNALGAVAAAGLLFLLATAVAAPVRGRLRTGTLDGAAALTVGLLVLGLTGGLAALFSVYVNPQVRAWNRISIFIGFFALLAVALLLDRGAAYVRGRSYGALLAPAVLALVLVVGALDQTAEPNEPYRDALATGYESDARFFGEVEQRLGSGEVFQLPAVRFPEFGSIHKMSDYDHARGYLHTSPAVSWSYGAQKGRPEDWTASLEGRPAPELAARAVAAGFEGIYVDRAAYTDGAAGLEGELREFLRSKPLISGDGRLAFYDARPFRNALQRAYSAQELDALRGATLYPLEVRWGAGFYGPETNELQEWRWATQQATLELEAPRPGRPVAFRAVIATGLLSPHEVRVRFPDGKLVRARASAAGARVAHEFQLRPGTNRVEFETAAPPSPSAPGDTRALHFRVVDAVTAEPAVEAFSADAMRRRGLGRR